MREPDEPELIKPMDRSPSMYVSLVQSGAKGFKRWSDVHQPYGNDNEGDVARLDALAVADLGIEQAEVAPLDQPRSPWLVPGMANTL